MSTKKVFGFYLGLIVLVVVAFIASLILELISMGLGAITGQMVSNIFQLFLISYLYALFFTAITCVYYHLRLHEGSNP
jgi:hypothetical protein